MWWPFNKTYVPTITKDNTIGAGTVVRGDLKSPGGFRIDGTVEGSVETEGPVIVGESGTVHGSVTASDVVVLGGVRGDVRASGHLEIGRAGRILGDISVQSLCMHKGGVFRGNSRMPGADDLAALDHPFGFLPSTDTEAQPRGTLPPRREAPPPPAPSRERLVDGRGDALEEEPEGRLFDDDLDPPEESGGRRAWFDDDTPEKDEAVND